MLFLILFLYQELHSVLFGLFAVMVDGLFFKSSIYFLDTMGFSVGWKENQAWVEKILQKFSLPIQNPIVSFFD